MDSPPLNAMTQRPQARRALLATLLPLLGTWAYLVTIGPVGLAIPGPMDTQGKAVWLPFTFHR